MVTTVAISDEAYKLIIRKQNDMFEKTGNRPSIKDIVDRAIRVGIDLVK